MGSRASASRALACQPSALQPKGTPDDARDEPACCSVNRPGVCLQPYGRAYSLARLVARSPVWRLALVFTPSPKTKPQQHHPPKAAAHGHATQHGRAASDAPLRSQRPTPCGTECMMPSHEPLLCTRHACAEIGRGRRAQKTLASPASACRLRVCVRCSLRWNPPIAPSARQQVTLRACGCEMKHRVDMYACLPSHERGRRRRVLAISTLVRASLAPRATVVHVVIMTCKSTLCVKSKSCRTAQSLSASHPSYQGPERAASPGGTRQSFYTSSRSSLGPSSTLTPLSAASQHHLHRHSILAHRPCIRALHIHSDGCTSILSPCPASTTVYESLSDVSPSSSPSTFTRLP
jgi:hypothetical protein